MPKKLSPEMQRIARTTHRYVEVQAGPGSGKTTAAIARVSHLLKNDPKANIALLSFSNAAVRNIRARLIREGVAIDGQVSVSTCHALAHRLSGSSSSARDPERGEKSAFKAMLKAGIKALKQKKVATEIDHLLVDEYQDCSRLQSKFIARLAKLAQSTVVLGDRMQSIYGFTGVRYRPLSDLLPNVLELPLSLSYRLTHQIAALANALAAPMGASQIRAQKNGKMPVFVEAPDSTTLARWVARRIQKLVAKGVAPSQIAVLGRNRSTARPVAQELRALGINSTLLGQTSGHMEQVFDVIAVLEAVEQSEWNPARQASAKRHQRRSTPGIRQLRERLRADLDEALDQNLGDISASRPQWAAFVKEIQKLVESGSVDPEGRFNACTQAYLRLMGGVRADKEMQIDLNAWQPICRLHPTAESLSQHAHTLMNGAAVTVTNIHQAKGLEWDHVFVYGVADGVLPDFRAADQGSLDNERSLLYVAVTRACERLWLCHAPIFGRQARNTFEEVSQFLTPTRVHKLMKSRRIDG